MIVYKESMKEARKKAFLFFKAENNKCKDYIPQAATIMCFFPLKCKNKDSCNRLTTERLVCSDFIAKCNGRGKIKCRIEYDDGNLV